LEKQVACPEILTRVLRNKGNLDRDGNVTEEAFLLRERDIGKLSVYRQALVSPEECLSTFRKTYGAVSLHTGRVRTINNVHPRDIDVIITESQDDPCPGHSAIVNLPDHSQRAQQAEAEYVASLLRDQCRKIL